MFARWTSAYALRRIDFAFHHKAEWRGRPATNASFLLGRVIEKLVAVVGDVFKDNAQAQRARRFRFYQKGTDGFVSRQAELLQKFPNVFMVPGWHRAPPHSVHYPTRVIEEAWPQQFA